MYVPAGLLIKRVGGLVGFSMESHGVGSNLHTKKPPGLSLHLPPHTEDLPAVLVSAKLVLNTHPVRTFVDMNVRLSKRAMNHSLSKSMQALKNFYLSYIN